MNQMQTERQTESPKYKTRTRLTTEDGKTALTIQHLDDDGRVVDGETKQFNTREEAETFMTTGKTSNANDTTNDTDQPQPDTAGTSDMEVNTDNVQAQEVVKEKPASQMTEADAVALNADVHVAVPNSDTDRIVTEGEKEQVAAGLHPKPEKGNPELKEDK